MLFIVQRTKKHICKSHFEILLLFNPYANNIQNTNKLNLDLFFKKLMLRANDLKR